MAMILMDRYVLPPGVCLVCMSGNLPAVSTGIDIHQPGQLQDSEVVICYRCILHMARMVGGETGYLVLPEIEVERTTQTIEELSARIVALNDERDKAYHARNALLASLGDTQWVPTEVEQSPAVVLTAEMVATVTANDEPIPMIPLDDRPPPKKPRR